MFFLPHRAIKILLTCNIAQTRIVMRLSIVLHLARTLEIDIIGMRRRERDLKYEDGFAISFGYVRSIVCLLRPSLAHCHSLRSPTHEYSAYALHILNMHRSPSFPLRSFTRCRYAGLGTRATDHSNRITRVSVFLTENYTAYSPSLLLLLAFANLFSRHDGRGEIRFSCVRQTIGARLCRVHTELLTID